MDRSQSTRGYGGTGQQAKPVKCHNCGRSGHLANVCRSPKKASTHQAHLASATKNKFKKPISCFKCGGSHRLSECTTNHSSLVSPFLCFLLSDFRTCTVLEGFDTPALSFVDAFFIGSRAVKNADVLHRAGGGGP
jgi:hypothetical protein